MFKFSALILVFLMNACSRPYDFEYKEDKAAYLDVVDCLRNNYSKIYDAANPTGPIYYSTTSYTPHALCGQLSFIQQRHALKYIKFEADSTVSFYSLTNGLADKQYILMFIPDRMNIQSKITPGMKVIEKKDENCYELEN
jgi:hypothetical protein